MLVLERYFYYIASSMVVLILCFLWWHYSSSQIKNNQHLIIQTPGNTLDALTSVEYLNFKSLLGGDDVNKAYTFIWGIKNLLFQEAGIIKNIFPKNSFKPSENPVGGGGFLYSLDKNLLHAKLTYDIKFAPNFQFVKGGKLPGLCGGTCSRGGRSIENGFSTRFMWRKQGDLEVYAYIPDKKISVGQSIGRGMFRFQPDTKYSLSQVIRLNTLGKYDGVLQVFVDNRLVYENFEMKFRDSEIYIDHILYSTFFGGGDRSWASPVDTSIEFSNFILEY